MRDTLVICILATLAGGCRRSSPFFLEKGGVALRQLDAVSAGDPTRQANVGDWSLASDRVRLVIAAGDLAGTARGAVVDAVTDDSAADELQELAPAVMAGGREVALSLRRIEPIERGGRPAVRLERRSADRRLALWTEITVAPGEPFARIWHRLYNFGDSSREGLRLGDRVRWPPAPTFVPGSGLVRGPDRAQASWIGRSGRLLSYGLLWPGGPVEVISRFEPHGPLDALLWSDPFTLSPGQSRADVRLLVVVPGDLAEVARVA